MGQLTASLDGYVSKVNTEGTFTCLQYLLSLLDCTKSFQAGKFLWFLSISRQAGTCHTQQHSQAHEVKSQSRNAALQNHLLCLLGVESWVEIGLLIFCRGGCYISLM